MTHLWIPLGILAVVAVLEVIGARAERRDLEESARRSEEARERRRSP